MKSASRGVSPPPTVAATFGSALRARVSSMRRIALAIALGSSFAVKASNSTGGVTDLRSGPAVLNCPEAKPDVRSNEEGGAVPVAGRTLVFGGRPGDTLAAAFCSLDGPQLVGEAAEEAGDLGDVVLGK